MDPWSAGNSDLGLGFVHRCFPWFPGGGRWGGMALHSHPGAPATHVPRLLADGVGAGSKRDRHGHRRGGKGSGRAASWSRGGWGGGVGVAGRCSAAALLCPLPAAPFLCKPFSLWHAHVFPSDSHRDLFRFPKITHLGLPFPSASNSFPCITTN